MLGFSFGILSIHSIHNEQPKQMGLKELLQILNTRPKDQELWGLVGKGSIIGTFGASSSAYGTNNKLVKLEVLVIGEYDTLRFLREALSRATLDMNLLETRLVFHYSYKDTFFMVSCDALEHPNMIVMDHNFVVQLVVWAGHVEDEELNALSEYWKQGGKITSPFLGLIDAMFLGE
ncbi:unnamed protein product [Prunus armeniaca]